jgi:hypothetical protein
MFHCILGLVALTVSGEWSALSCLVAVTTLSLRNTLPSLLMFPYYYYYYYYYYNKGLSTTTNPTKIRSV